jgi:CRISPR-associated protein Csx3
MKIILGGPPHSGKSCLRYGLKEALKVIPGSCYPYVITACPDGEGAWFQETFSSNNELALQLRLPYKSKFTQEKVALWADWVSQCSEPLTIIDIGGKLDEKNETICREATHAILVTGCIDALPPWRDFCMNLGIQIIAEIHSDLHGSKDLPLIKNEKNTYSGTVHHLERGDITIKNRPTVIELARILLELGELKRYKIMGSYNITAEKDNVLRLAFGENPAQNDVLVKETAQKIEALINMGAITGGEIIKLNGPASLPIAFVLAHKLNHLYQAIAVFDPKISKYVVAIAHGDKYKLGDLISLD